MFISLNILLVSIVCIDIIFSQREPIFCETPVFDSVFHYYTNIVFVKNNIMWKGIVKSSYTLIQEPPIQMPEFGNPGSTLVSGFFIKQVPLCPQSYNYCNEIKKAKDLLFLRQRDNSGVESTVVLKYNITYNIVSPADYPFNMSGRIMFWPQDWDYTQSTERPVLYFDRNYEIMFIVFSGEKDRVSLHYNNISTIDWYKNMNKVSLNTDIKFVGMFQMKDKAYIVGEDPNDPIDNRETKVYQLDINTKTFIYTEKLRKFFGCIINNIPIKTSTQPINNEIENEENIKQSKESDSKSQSIIIIVVSVVLIIIIFAFIVIFVFIRTKGNKISTPAPKLVVKPKADETATRVSSIETIHSTTGHFINEKLKKPKK